MAELLIKIGSVSPNQEYYQDGDIVNAWSDNKISAMHASCLCHTNRNRYNADGLNIINGVAYKYLMLSALYKYVRLSRNELKRINLKTRVVDRLSNIPNSNGEYIDLSLWLNRRQKNANHNIFGVKNKEVWFGHTNYRDTATDLNKIWQMIETNTIFRASNFKKWPLSNTEKRNFLALSVDDFSETEQKRITSSEYSLPDIKGVTKMIKKRSNNVLWKTFNIGETINRIKDRTRIIDVRNNKIHIRASIIKKKI